LVQSVDGTGLADGGRARGHRFGRDPSLGRGGRQARSLAPNDARKSRAQGSGRGQHRSRLARWHPDDRRHRPRFDQRAPSWRFCWCPACWG
jgi:hypothetical protein